MNMVNAAKEITDNISKIEYKLMDTFWPGPFTIILERKDIVPNVVTGGLDTVGVRMPSSAIAKWLIEYSNTPIAAPSANISGRPSGTNVEDIFKELSDKGVYVMLSNHNTKFINELYKGFHITVVPAKRMINSKADGRGAVEEVIITNYE